MWYLKWYVKTLAFFRRFRKSSDGNFSIAVVLFCVQITAQQVDMEFERVLTKNGVATDTIQKLASNGLKSMYISPICIYSKALLPECTYIRISVVIFSDVLREIDIEDLNQMCSEWGIPFLQKAKLKAAIRNIQKESQCASQPQSNLPPVWWYIHSL